MQGGKCSVTQSGQCESALSCISRHLHGAYKGGTPPFECAPLGVDLRQDGTLAAKEPINELIVEGGAHNRAARAVFAGSDIVMTASWNATVELYEYHRELADGRGHECGKGGGN